MEMTTLSFRFESRAAFAPNGDGRPGDDGPDIPGNTPAEVPADNRDPGNEIPMPDGDTQPLPDTTSPTPAPTEVPQTGGSFTGSASDQDEIDADTVQNGGIGNALNMNAGAIGEESATEAAMARAADAG